MNGMWGKSIHTKGGIKADLFHAVHPLTIHAKPYFSGNEVDEAKAQLKRPYPANNG